MPENFIHDYWPQILFCGMTIFGFGKGWQLISVMCKTLKEHSVELKVMREQHSGFCLHAECEKYRESCAARNDKQFAEVKSMLIAMDTKRENSRDSTQDALSDIACRISRLETKMEK